MKVRNEPVRARLQPVPYYGSRRHIVTRKVVVGAAWTFLAAVSVGSFVFFFVAPWLR